MRSVSSSRLAAGIHVSAPPTCTCLHLCIIRQPLVSDDSFPGLAIEPLLALRQNTATACFHRNLGIASILQAAQSALRHPSERTPAPFPHNALRGSGRCGRDGGQLHRRGTANSNSGAAHQYRERGQGGASQCARCSPCASPTPAYRAHPSGSCRPSSLPAQHGCGWQGCGGAIAAASSAADA
jgi:hypothetical protein